MFEGVAKTGDEKLGNPSLICNLLLRDIFFSKLHHVHDEHIQLERFRQLEMWSGTDRIDEILGERSYLSDVFAKTELCCEDSAMVIGSANTRSGLYSARDISHHLICTVTSQTPSGIGFLESFHLA